MITIESCEKKLEKQFKIVDDIGYKNQKKVLNAFIDCRL